MALKQVEEWAERRTYPVPVIHGPEGCAKNALFRQAMKLLREHGYEVVQVNSLSGPLEDRMRLTDRLRELLRDLPGFFGEAVRLVEDAVGLLTVAYSLLPGRNPNSEPLGDGLGATEAIEDSDAFLRRYRDA